MAATPVSKFSKSTPDNLAYEVFTVDNGAGDTSFTITPTAIKSIVNVTVISLNSTAAASVAYLSSFVVGNATAVVVGVNSGSYLVKIEGVIA